MLNNGVKRFVIYKNLKYIIFFEGRDFQQRKMNRERERKRDRELLSCFKKTLPVNLPI